MSPIRDSVLGQLQAKYKGIKPAVRPSWLAHSRWNPAFCLSLPNSEIIVAIDWIPSGNIPRAIYRQEVKKLKQEHKHLRAIVCVLDSLVESFPDTVAFCREIGCGLQSLIPEVGLRTIVVTDLDKTGELEATIEPGWFPKPILEKAKDLNHLAFHQTIDEFCQQASVLAENEGAAIDLVRNTVDSLLQSYPKCHANIGSYMKLAHFESLFRQAVPNATEHVLHSFRVFLVGCIIINRFYESFHIAHKRFCLGSERKMSIEYSWLLTAIFHDIGHPVERGRLMLEAELEDDDIAVSVVGRDTRWVKEKYIHARRLLASLAMFVASNPADDDEWDYGAVPDDLDRALAAELTDLYDKMSSHAIISAINMLANIFDQARAVNERNNRPFVVTHAAPAALAILLHDWRIWDKARKWKLFPIDSGIIPMAALLIFIDTWDDFRRTGQASPISIESFSLNDAGVKVTVKWLRAEEYEKEKVKYIAFKKALKNRRFGMDISLIVAS